MLFTINRLLFGNLALFDLRQTLVVFVRAVVAAFLVDTQEAVEQHDLTVGTQHDLPILAANIHGRAFHPRRFHLAGQRALPDQIIQLALIGILDLCLRCVDHHIRRADTFVRLLRVLRLVFVDAGVLRDVIVAKLRLDRVARTGHRFWCHVDAVGPHIRDESGLIQALCNAHALLCAHAEFTASFLLQGRGHEGWAGVAAGGLRLHALDGQIARGDRLHSHFGLRCVTQIEFIKFFAAKNRQARLVICAAGVFQNRADGPVFLIAKGFDFHLAFDDQT